eukprot:330807-Pleurochrysis_carterae.AAC.1
MPWSSQSQSVRPEYAACSQRSCVLFFAFECRVFLWRFQHACHRPVPCCILNAHRSNGCASVRLQALGEGDADAFEAVCEAAASLSVDQEE